MAKRKTRSSTGTQSPKALNESDRNVPDADVYSFLTAYFLHQDRLSWSRTQTIFAVEAAILAASFAKPGVVAIFALVVGIVIVYLVWGLVKRDWQIRDQNLAHLDAVHRQYNIRMTVDG